MSGIFNSNIKSKIINDIIKDVSNPSSNYYIGFGKTLSWPDENNPDPANSSISTSFYDVSKNLLFGKRLSMSDFAFVTTKHQWTSSTVYAQYDDTDANLYDKAFYVITSVNQVYKCLFNNYGAPSTVEPPSFATYNNRDFDTSDGYKWKYMYTVDDLHASKFITDTYIPILPENQVTVYAERGAIHVVPISNQGVNYTTGTGSIDEVINSTNFKLANSAATANTGAYNQSTMYIYENSGKGNYATVSNYVVNSSGKYVSTYTPIEGVDSTSLFVISPQVVITGDGTGAAAYSVVDANTGNVVSINMITRGINYTTANVSIVANSYFGSGATAYAIISPKDGHGANSFTELGCKTIGISATTSRNDNFPSWGQYRQVSFLYNPTASSNGTLFQDASFNQMTNFGILVPPTSPMTKGETVVGFSSGAEATVAYMNTTSLYVVYDSGNFQPYETLTSVDTGKTCIISTINNKDLIPYSAELYYYKNIQEISRTGINSEEVKLYFNL